MNIDIDTRITLDDNNTYLIVDKVKYEDRLFFCLADINNNANIKLCYEDKDDNSMIECLDEKINLKLAELFFTNASEQL